MFSVECDDGVFQEIELSSRRSMELRATKFVKCSTFGKMHRYPAPLQRSSKNREVTDGGSVHQNDVVNPTVR